MTRAHTLRLAVAAAVATAAIAGAADSAAAGRAPEPRVVVVLDQGGCSGDKETLRLCDGIARALRRTGVRGRIVAPSLQEDVGDFLGLIAKQRYDAVVLWSIWATRDFEEVARRHPDTRFIVMDASRKDLLPAAPRNVQGIVFQTREAAFLAGWLAAKLELRRAGRDVVGVVGGLAIPSVTNFVDGFAAGARRAAPQVTVLVDYSNDFVDPSKCAALARRQIARGAGTVFNVAGGCGLGTMRAAADAGVWAVGVDSDQSFLGPHVLTSVLKSFEIGFLEVLGQVKERRVRTGTDTVLTIRDGASGLGRISPKVPRPLVRQIDELRRRMVAGQLRVRGIVPSAPGG